jgi:hypothetical protein
MFGVVHSDREEECMILVKQAPAGFIAQLYDGDEPDFNVKHETYMQDQLNQGAPVAKPPPPYTKYGPGGYRMILNPWLHETGHWSPSLDEAVASLRSRKNIKAAQARIKRAEAKLEFERRRLAALTDPQRTFHEDGYTEVINDTDA